MFIGSSGPMQPDFFVLTLGHTCRYAVVTEQAIDLFDVGASCHVGPLLNRFKSLGLEVSKLRHIFMTHLHADRVGGVEQLRQVAPKIQVWGSGKMKEILSSHDRVAQMKEQDSTIAKMFGGEQPSNWSAPNIDKVFVEGEAASLSADIVVRSLSLAGHTDHSVGFLIQPYNFLVGDESLGYFHGARNPGVGADESIESNIKSLTKLLEMEIHGICLPDSGMLTGALAPKHWRKVVKTLQALPMEKEAHRRDGMSPEEISSLIHDDHFLSDSSDPVVRKNVEGSFISVMKQLTN